MSKANEVLARYATRARHELAALPEGPAHAALVTVLDHALDHHRLASRAAGSTIGPQVPDLPSARRVITNL